MISGIFLRSSGCIWIFISIPCPTKLGSLFFHREDIIPLLCAVMIHSGWIRDITASSYLWCPSSHTYIMKKVHFWILPSMLTPCRLFPCLETHTPLFQIPNPLSRTLLHPSTSGRETRSPQGKDPLFSIFLRFTQISQSLHSFLVSSLGTILISPFCVLICSPLFHILSFIYHEKFHFQGSPQWIINWFLSTSHQSKASGLRYGGHSAMGYQKSSQTVVTNAQNMQNL